MRLFFLMFDLGMAAILFFLGLLFHRSNGKAANYLTGYNQRPAEERQKYDEAQLCKIYGKRMMGMALPFLPGAVVDWFFPGAGCVLAWGVWLLLFLLLLAERRRREG